MMKEKSRRWRAASLLAAVLLAVLTLGGCGGMSNEELANTLSDLRILTTQLQEVFTPQLSRDQGLHFLNLYEKNGALTGMVEFMDPGLALDENGQRTDAPVQVATFRIEDGAMTFDAEGGRPGFYRDYLIPSGEFAKNDVDDNPIDLSRLTVDQDLLEESWAENADYRTEACGRLNDFFGTRYLPDQEDWFEDLRGQYAVVFSVDRSRKEAEILTALAELDQTEGLSVTGIYYSANGDWGICKPYRNGDRIGTERLDPRESLRALAVGQTDAHMLMHSDLFGMDYAPSFRHLLDNLDDLDIGREVIEIRGACVVAEEDSFLTPEMVEAISKVCYRCIDVWLLDNSY